MNGNGTYEGAGENAPSGCPTSGAVSSYAVLTSFNVPPIVSNLTATPKVNCGTVSGAEVLLNWNYDDIEGEDQDRYYYQIATDSGFANIICERDTGVGGGYCANGGNCSSVSTCSLNWGTTYWSQLEVWDESGKGSGWIYPVPASFTTAAHSYPYVKFYPAPSSGFAGEKINFIQNDITPPEEESNCYDDSDVEYLCEDFPDADVDYVWDFSYSGTVIPDAFTEGNAEFIYDLTEEYDVYLEITDKTLSPPGACYALQTVTINFPLPEWREIPPFDLP